MMRGFQYIILFISFFVFQNLKAQYKIVLFDETELQFNQGEPLPADQYFIINGYANPNVELVRFYLQKNGARNTPDPILYENFWKRSNNNKGLIYELPINYALKGSVKYDVFFEHYTRIDSISFKEIKQNISEEIEAYVDKNLVVSKSKLKIRKSAKEFDEDIEKIIKENTKNLHNKVEFSFQGFSTELKERLKKIARSKKNKEGEQNLKQIKALIERDINRFVNTDLVQKDDEYKLVRYPIEKTSNILAINLGYGATVSKDFNKFENSSSPFIGISIPFSNRQYSSAFIKNSAISFGIALKNYEDKNGNTVTGPIIKRPIYAAIGYKIFRVIRLNAGFQLLSVEEDGVAEPLGNLQLLPFFGMSVELDVWVGVGKRKKIRKR